MSLGVALDEARGGGVICLPQLDRSSLGVTERPVPEVLKDVLDRDHWMLLFAAFVRFQYKGFQDRGGFVRDPRSLFPFHSGEVNREVVADNAEVLINHFCSTPPHHLDAMRNLGCRLGKADGFADLLDSSKVFTVQSDQIGSDDQKRRVDRIIDAQPGGLPSIREILELDERVHHDRWLAARKNLEAAAAAAGSPLPPHEGSKPFEQLSSHQRWVSQFQSLMNCVTLARLSENAYALIRSVAQAKLREALVRALDQKLAEVKNPDSPYFPFDGKLLSLCDIRNAIAAKEWGPLAEEQAPVWWELLLGRSKAPAPKSRSD